MIDNRRHPTGSSIKPHRLPTLPHVLVRLLRCLHEESSSFQRMAEIIGQDAAISARVIALANSSFYNRAVRIDTIERALLILGTETLRTLVITAAFHQFFSTLTSDQSIFLKKFWRRSLTAALIAKSVATLTSYRNPDEAYLTGLLHNVGELVLLQQHGTTYLEVLADVMDESEQLENEQNHFGTDHTDIARLLAEKWHLGEFVADALQYHHATGDAVLDAHHLVKITHLASLLSLPSAASDHASFSAAEQQFGLTAALTRELLEQIEVEVASSAQTIKIDLSDDDSDVREQNAALLEEVNRLGLLHAATLQLSRSENEEQLCRNMLETAEMLFGTRHALLFRLVGESLVCRDIAENAAAELRVPLKKERSLVAAALIEHTVLSSSDRDNKELPVIDHQLIRLAGGKGILCVPLYWEDTELGALVLGADRPGIGNEQGNLLTTFAREASRVLFTLRTTEIELQSRSNLQDEDIQLQLRKIIHEANNPLSIIRNYLSTLGIKLREGEKVDDELEILREEIDRTGDIIMRLQDLKMPAPASDAGVNINDEIRSLIQLLEGSLFLTHGVECQADLDEGIEPIASNRTALRQILTNLLKNAVEALPRGGLVEVSSRPEVIVNGRRFIEIVIKDDGPGIADTVKKNLFRPVQSTKGKGHSGLGLSIVKNLTDELKGSIGCRTSNQGTEFQLLLPIPNSL